MNWLIVSSVIGGWICLTLGPLYLRYRAMLRLRRLLRPAWDAAAAQGDWRAVGAIGLQRTVVAAHWVGSLADQPMRLLGYRALFSKFTGYWAPRCVAQINTSTGSVIVTPDRTDAPRWTLEDDVFSTTTLRMHRFLGGAEGAEIIDGLPALRITAPAPPPPEVLAVLARRSSHDWLWILEDQIVLSWRVEPKQDQAAVLAAVMADLEVLIEWLQASQP